MKILFFIDCMVGGGKERRLTELMKMLKLKPGIEFELVVMSKEIHYQEVLDLGIKIHYVIRKTKKDLSVFRTFYKLCKLYKPDIAHCWDFMTGIYLIPTCKLLGIKLISGMVANTPARQNFKEINWGRARLIFPFSDVIIGNSLAGLEGYRAPKAKSICIYNGFNFERLNKIEEPDVIKKKFGIKACYVILMVGAFEERKDYDSYIEAAKILCDKRNDVEFIAVGGGVDLPRILDKVGSDFSNRIKLLGTQMNVESIINISDICVLATNSSVHGEGISNSILEYMAFGKPVIASSGGGTNEIIEDKKTGFLVSPKDPVELAEKMEILLNNEELRNKMGIAAKERIRNYFSIESMVNKYISTYNSSLTSPHSSYRLSNGN